MADYSDSELANAFGTSGLAYGQLNPSVAAKQTPYDTNAVDEFSLMRGIIDDYVNPQVLKSESEFVGIVVKVERNILSCKDEGQKLKTIETTATTFEDCKDPGKDPSRTSIRAGVLMNPEEVKAWQPKHKEFLACKERNKEFTTNLLNAEKIQNNVGYVRVCIPELDPRPLPSVWPSSKTGELQSACLKEGKLALSIAETYPVFKYGMSLQDQNFITPGALVRVVLTYKPMGPRGVTSGIPDVSQGGHIIEVIRNENSQPIIMGHGNSSGAKKAKETTDPCLEPPLPPQIVADPTQQDEALTNVAGLPQIGKMDEIFIGDKAHKKKQQLTKNLYLKDFGPGKLPRKYWKNAKILAMNLEVLIQYLYPGGVTRDPKVKARKFIEFRISSGYRSRKKNAHTEGTSKVSQHMLCRASDIVFKEYSPRQVFLAISDLIYRGAMKDGGLGYYSYGKNIKTGRQKGFVHYDVRNSGAKGRGDVPTTTHWTAAHGGPRWYLLDKKAHHTGGLETNIKKELEYWTTSPPPGQPVAQPGIDDAAAPPAAKE
jgi:hypothetical protein